MVRRSSGVLGGIGMRVGSAIGVLALALGVSGCALGPQSCEPCVSTDLIGYLQREWPLHGQRLPQEACLAQDGCQAAHKPACSGPVHRDDWDQPTCHPHAYGGTDDPPPAVPLEPPDRGRFFPVPSRPAFDPQPVQWMATPPPTGRAEAGFHASGKATH